MRLRSFSSAELKLREDQLSVVLRAGTAAASRGERKLPISADNAKFPRSPYPDPDGTSPRCYTSKWKADAQITVSRLFLGSSCALQNGPYRSRPA
jgi:hypothetical protein